MTTMLLLSYQQNTVKKENWQLLKACLNWETLLRKHCFGSKCFSWAALETYVAETNLAARKQKVFLPQVKNNFAYRAQILRPKHIFTSLAAMETMFTSFQCCSSKMTDHNVEVEEPKTGHRKGKKELEGKGQKGSDWLSNRWVDVRELHGIKRDY